MVSESDFLNDRQVEDFQMIAEIVNEMAVSDGFTTLENCLAEHPENLGFYNRYAIAALRAVRRVQGYGVKNI